MKILQVNKYHYVKGGADVVFFNTINLLEKHGHEVMRFCTRNPKNVVSNCDAYFTDAPEIRDLSLISKIKSLPQFFWNTDAAQKMEQLIAVWKPDVAHLHNIFNGISLSILPVLHKHHIPVVISMHDTRFICPSSEFNLHSYCNSCLRFGGLHCGIHHCYQQSFVNSWMCALEMLQKEKFFHYDKYIDKYIFLSEHYKNMHTVKHQYFAEKGTVLYNFTKMKPLADAPLRGDYMLYYGRITAEKGVETLLEAMRRMPNVRLKMAGTGPLLEKFKSEKPNNVEMLGFRSGLDLQKEIENASFVILPSECEENNPLSIIEANMCRKPVLASRKSGIPEIVNDGSTGFLFEPANVDSMCEIIAKAQHISDEKYCEMSQNAFIFAKEHFEEEVHYAQLMKIYTEVTTK